MPAGDRSRSNLPNVLLVGDSHGVAQALPALSDRGVVVGLVAASNRPQYHAELHRMAGRHGVPLLVQPPWDTSDYRAFVAAAARLRPALIVCNSYSMILRDDLLALAPAVNVHGGALPGYRGPNPIQWQMIEDERMAGVAMHHVEADIDAGDLIAERRVPIHFDDTWRAVSDRVAAATEELLRAELPAVLAGSAGRRPQDEAAARTWPRRGQDASRIDWSWSVLRIYNFIRALGDGIPPAFYEHDGRRVELDRRVPLAEVVALVHEPGPGRRRITRGALELVPEPGDFIRFRVLRDGRAIGSCGFDAAQLDRRSGRAWAQPVDLEVVALVAAFAVEQLGFAVEHDGL